MADFDAHLRTRLERLDAAIPQPARPALSAARRRPRRRQALLLFAATVVLALGTALVTTGSPPPMTPQEASRNAALTGRVERALAPLFPEDECVGHEEAARRLRQGLDELGLHDWGIRTDSTIPGARCVMFGAAADIKAVILLGRADPGVPAAMDQVADQLLAQCFTAAEASELVEKAMLDLGVTQFVVSTDPLAPKAAPIDKAEAYQQHVADGCFVYSSTQLARDGSGRLVVYLWGPWP